MLELIHGLPIVQASRWSAGLSKYPTTPGQHVIILDGDNLFRSSPDDFQATLSFVRDYAQLVQTFCNVRRCGLAYDGHRSIHIIPMHGLSADWVPIRGGEVAPTHTYPGYLWTKGSPPMGADALDEVQGRVVAQSGWHQAEHTFHGDRGDTNVFAQLVRGEIAQWRVWEDEHHVGFLTPFGNSVGFSVVIPRQHLSSDILGLARPAFLALVSACRQVALALSAGLRTRRVGMFFEGFEIDYAHAKLVPVLDDQAGIAGPSDEFHQTYPGFLSTRLGPLGASDALDETRSRFQSFVETQTRSAPAVEDELGVHAPPPMPSSRLGVMNNLPTKQA